MAKFIKPIYSVPFAATGPKTQPAPDLMTLGWTAIKPPYELENFLQNRQDTGLAYLLQMGIPEWDATTEYQINSYIQYGGIIYVGLAVSVNQQPDVAISYWKIAAATPAEIAALTSELDALKTLCTANGIGANLGDTNLYTGDVNSLTTVGVYVVESPAINTAFGGGEVIEVKREDAIASVVYQISQSVNGQGIATRTLFNRGSPARGWTPWAYSVTTASSFGGLNILTNLQNQINALQTQINSQRIAVGDLFLTTLDFATGIDVGNHLGYGVWVRYGEGYALVGKASAGSTQPDWTKNINSGFGEYDHYLTIPELPPHSHTLPYTPNIRGAGFTDVSGVHRMDDGTSSTSTVGSGAGHNNVQPSIVVGCWYRSA